MDFHCMKRKQLQTLCKNHKIPANLSNLEMANRLTEFLQEVKREQEETVREIESVSEVVNKKGKKVRFSPDHELIEFTRSPKITKIRSRRNSVSCVQSNWSVEIVESGEMNKETVGRQGSTTQTGELKLVEAEVKQKKRGRIAAKYNDAYEIASGVDSFKDDELEEGDVVKSGRITRLRGKMAAEGVDNASKRERKGAKGDDKREKASDIVKNDEHQEEIVKNHSRVTRSRAQKLTEAPAAEEKRGRKAVKNIGKLAALRAETGDDRKSSVVSLSKGGDEGEGNLATGSDERIKGNEKGLKEILVNKKIAVEHVNVELLLRRSKRKATGVAESEKFTSDTSKYENGEVKGSRKTSKLLASNVSKVDTETSGVEVNPSRRVLKTEEPIQKMKPRRSTRRKTMIESNSLRGDTLRSSLPQSDIVPEVSKDEKMVIQPIGVVRRSRHNTLSQKLVSASDSNSAVENLEVGKHISASCLVEKKNHAVQKNTLSTRNTSKCKPQGSLDKFGGDSNIHKENKLMKRKRGHVTGDVIKNKKDLNSGAQSLKGSSSEKVVSASATGKYNDERNQPHRLDSPNMLDASSCYGSSGTEESLFLEVQLSASKDSERANNLCSENIISDVDLTYIKETHNKKEEVSVADSADGSCMNLTIEEYLVNSDTNAASKSAELGTESSVSKNQNSTCNIVEVQKGKLLLEVDVQETVEQNITYVDNNDPEAQAYSPMEGSGCNNKINNQVLAEGLTDSREEASAESRSSADSFLLGDQPDVKTDLKVAETEVDGHLQSHVRVVDNHNDLDHLGASSNIPDNNNEDTSQTSGEDRAFESCGTDQTHSKSISKLKAPSSGLNRHHGDDAAEGNETFFLKGRVSELVEADEGGCSKDQRNESDHFSEFDVPDLSDDEVDARIVSPNGGIFPDEYSVMNSDEHCKDFQAVAPTAICTDSTYVNLKRGHEDVQMAKEEERYIYEGIYADLAETCESESSKGHKNKCDEDGEFSLAKLFDEEGRYGITPQEKENLSAEHSVTDFNEHGMSHGSPSIAPITMCNSTGDHKANLSAEGGEAYNSKNKQSELTEADESGCLKSHKNSNSQETNPSTPSSVSETQVEKQESLLAKSSALTSANQRQGIWSNASELLGNAVCFLKSSEGKISQVAEGLIVDEDVNHANYGTDKEVSAHASISDVKSCPVSKIVAESLGDGKFQDRVETEHQHRNLVARQTESDADKEATLAISRQSWKEAELQNLFGASEEDAPPARSDTFCEESEAANMTMSKNKPTASNSGVLTKKQEKEMEGESSIKRDADIYENEFKLLFATPVKITTPYKTEETYSHDRLLDGRVTSIKEWSDVMKYNVAKGSTSSEKAQNAGYDNEKNLSIGASLSDNGGDDICEEMNKVESFELLNTSTRVLSGAECDGCEALEDQLTQNKEECLQETNSSTEEGRKENDTSLAQSCVNDKVTENSIISKSRSSWDLYEREIFAHMSETRSCKSKVHNKSEGEMIQSTIAELSDADLQKSDVPENTHLLTASSNDGDMDTSIETSSNPEVAKIGISEEDVTEKGISPFLSFKASLDCGGSNCDDQYEAKKLDEKDGNPKSSEYISDELHTNSEMAVKESVSIGYNMCRELEQLTSSNEPESTYKEAKGMETPTQILYNTDAAAEHGSFVCGAVFSPLSISAMHISSRYQSVISLDDEKVQGAGFELGNSLCIGDLVSDDGGEDTCGKMTDVESVELNDTSTTVLYETEFDGCEAFEEQLTENTEECRRGMHFMTEGNEEKVTPLGQYCLYDEETDNDSESREANINSMSGTPNSLDKLEGCQEVLTDTVLSESLKCKRRVDQKSEQEMPQSTEAAVQLSNADLRKSNISKSSQHVIDKGTPIFFFLQRPPLSMMNSQSTDLKGAKICDEIDAKANSSQDMSIELHSKSEVAILKNLLDSNNQSEEAGLACGFKLESMFVETKETGTATQKCNNIAAPTDHGSSVCGAEMHLHLRDENNDIKNVDVGKPVFSLSSDNDKKDSENVEESSTAQMVQFPIHELHFEENVEDFKNDTYTISNLPASRFNEIVRESDVADTIKEYIIDSESSLPVIFDNNHASLPSNMLAETDSENSASSKYEKDIAARLDCLTPVMKILCHSSSKDEDNVPSVDCLDAEIKEQEEAKILTRPAQVSVNAAYFPDHVDEGTTVKLESQKNIEQEDDQSSSPSIVMKNARTILIHGTPGKLLATANMKENVPNQKHSNISDITAVRPVKRRPLQDLQWK